MIFTFDKSDFCQMTAALLAGDLELAVELCVKQDRFAEALVLAIRARPELLQTTQVIFSPQLRFHSRPNLIFSRPRLDTSSRRRPQGPCTLPASPWWRR